MRSIDVVGSGEPRALRSRTHRIAVAATVAVALVWLAAAAGARPPRPSTAVGRELGRVAGPRSEPVLAPARIARVAVVPGARSLEAWAYGHTHWREPGYSQTDPQGQGVLLSWMPERGWRIEQPLLDATGAPATPGVTDIDLAPGGEGWGVGMTGLLFHRPPGDRWTIHEQSGAVAAVDLADVSLGRDASGVYGWAVGAGPTFLRLRDGRWEHDLGSVRSAGGAGDLLGNVVSVAAVDRERAWAVASSPRQLVLYRRTAAEGWQRVQTGDPLFDIAPSVHDGGGSPVVNQFASGAAVAAGGGVVWVTGALQPVDAQRYANQRGPGADPQRPFALRIDEAGTFTSYCPPLYQLSSGGITSTSRICDEPFPMAVGSLPAIDALPDGTAFAGGAGLFRFAGDRWSREPNVAGLVSSLAFHSGSEGWVASFGNRTADGGSLAASTSPTVGHWTTAPPARSMLRRWPHPSREALEGVALQPGGDGAIAVGGGGEILRLEPGIGWDRMRSPVSRALHDVVWPAPDRAWAVGDGGVVLAFDGRRWHEHAASRRLTSEPLYAMAFRGPGAGIAVGGKGTILRYDGTAWRRDRQSGAVSAQRLLAVAFAGADAIAVGEKSTILVDRGAGWIADATAPGRFKTLQEGRVPGLTSVIGFPDGRAMAGGELSILVERAPGGRFERARSHPMLSGSVLALASGDEGRTLLASIATEPSGRVAKYGGSGLLEPTGWLFASDGRTWRAVGDERVAEAGPDVDAPVRRDAVYDIAVARDGRGFAAGGYPADLADDDGHVSSLPSGSLWRLDAGGNPEPPPNVSVAPVRGAPGSTSFAFVADTACANGLCSAASGMGARADEILTRALADIDRAAGSGDVRFVAFGGDFRRSGIPDELRAIGGMLDSLGVPSFAAIGDQDLFGGVDAAGESLLASNGYYLSAFADRPAPWGHAPPPATIRPVSPPGEAQADSTLARTHYAFDYLAAGRPALRMIFLDTSRAAQEIAFQNPPMDQDSAWLRPLLAEATSLGVPAVVVMHQPLLASIGTGARTGTLTAALAGSGVSAVLASHERVNRLISYLDPVRPFPVAILGSTGGALAGDWRPDKGAYHAWLHVSVPPVGAVRIRSIPVLESVALSAPSGRAAVAGETLRFEGLARIPDTGGDPQADRAHYLRFPMARGCAGPLETPESAACVAADTLRPDHEFACEDERVCVFVREDPSRPGMPARDASGAMTKDPASGLMCALSTGRTHVSLRAGVLAARAPVTVTGGDGPCIPARIVDPAAPTVVFAAESQHAPVPRDLDAPPQILKPKTFEVAAIPALAPPPVQPAPAPPGGGAAKYEEERESATETAEMTALDPSFRRAASRPPSPVAGGVLGLAAVAAAIALARRMRARPQPAPKVAARPSFAGSPPRPYRFPRTHR